MSTGRLEAFSDGVFAVAITLLVLDIHPPPDAGNASELWRRLGDLWPHYAAYAVSFLVIGIVWVNHHAVMDLIAAVNRQFAFLSAPVCLAMHATLAIYYALSRRGGGMARPEGLPR